MSGIAGIIRFDGAPVEPGLVEKMTAAMPYRGPDGIHHWVKGSVAMGQCMLHTTPESLEEIQPLTNEDESLVLVMDGRLDNWIELRKELLGRGVVLRNHSDAELVLRSYEVWGKDCLPHIDGDFALVIWDARRQVAFCARDRVGNKPFNYHWDGKIFSFASELHTILALPWVKQELNQGMLAECLGSEWHSRDETSWIGIMRLVAAHQMVASSDGLQKTQYWTPDFSTILPYTKQEEFVEHYRELFTDIVRRTSRSHKNLACEVSGGLDSSAIFAMAQHLSKQDSLLAPSIDGYTLDYRHDEDANELKYARAVGTHWQKKIYEILPSSPTISWYRQWAEHYRDFLPYPTSSSGLGIRKIATSNGSRALMTGFGGDEWLWGDKGYYADLLSSFQWQELYHCLKIDINDAGFRQGIQWLVRNGMLPFLPRMVKEYLRKFYAILKRRDGVKDDDKQAWLTPPMQALIRQRRLRYNNLLKIDAVRAGLRKQFLTLNSGYLNVTNESEERLAASVGIELRQPFRHARMVQFAFSTPTQRRLQGNVDRVIHRQAMVKLLPDVVVHRDSKAGFNIDFQAPLAELYKSTNERVPTCSSAWIDPEQATQLWNERGLDNSDGWTEFRLWSLFACACVAKND